MQVERIAIYLPPEKVSFFDPQSTKYFFLAEEQHDEAKYVWTYLAEECSDEAKKYIVD